MTVFPDDLPGILHYRVGKTIRIALPRTPVAYHGSSVATNATQVCPQVPLGCSGWQLVTDPKGFWRELSELPPAWMPFLNRERGTVMDPRHK